MPDEPDAKTEEKWARVTEVAEAFSPGAPITSQDLFSGRVLQMAKIMQLVGRRGQHGVLYGERGVGKTSLAAVVSQILSKQGRLTVRVNCGAGDTFARVWTRIFSEISLSTERQQLGFGSSRESELINATDLLPTDPEMMTADRVRGALEVVSSHGSIVVFVDEFDRLQPGEERAPFADLIKGLSDYVVKATIVIVGVADDVDDLVAEHRSVERALQEILMPRMSPEESRQIVERGLDSVAMTIERDALERIVELSKGLPHYTHLLAQEAAIATAWLEENHISATAVSHAIEEAIDKAQQTVTNDYLKAIYSPRSNVLYPHVLRACALTKKDELGFFAPADVREPLSELLGRRVDIPIFQQHLHAFTGASRAAVLLRKGEPRRFRYRFRNPLLEPYVILRGIKEDKAAKETTPAEG